MKPIEVGKRREELLRKIRLRLLAPANSNDGTTLERNLLQVLKDVEGASAGKTQAISTRTFGPAAAAARYRRPAASTNRKRKRLRG